MLLPLLIMTLLLGVHSDAELKHFRPEDKKVVPRALIESDELCPRDEREACWKWFVESGRVWLADVNGDKIDEVLISSKMWIGSGGQWFFLYRRRAKKWAALKKGGWQTLDPRFDILPIVRQNHYDLRISRNRCLKWNETEYIDYEPDDYHRLSPSLFNASDPLQAEIFWSIRYAGLKVFKLEPQWFPFLGEAPAGSVGLEEVELNDPEYGLRWVALFKSGVWGVRDKRGFLLLPRPGYLGASKLEFAGDWLLIFGDSSDDEPVARYNRHTQELRIEGLIPFASR